MILADSLQRKSLADAPTAGLLALMIGGQAALYALVATGRMPAAIAVLPATLLMNLSFTIWHECSHRNFSRVGWVNDAVGALGSFFSLGPAYFHRKHEHLIHHRYEGDPERDPVYARIQSGFLEFAGKLVRLAASGTNPVRYRELMPLAPWKVACDRALLALTLALPALSVARGEWAALVAVFLWPRALVFFLHAYYICFFPHQKESGGFELYRVRPGRPALAALTLNQSLHGVHHMAPTVPWHRYPRLLAELRKSERAGELEVISYCGRR